MEKPFVFSLDNKRYHTYDFYLKETFGGKCAKIGLDGSFTCPNRDGTKGRGGCAFCAGTGAETAPDAHLPLVEQFRQGRDRLRAKWGDLPAIAYFQAGTSTWAPVEVLRAKYEEVLSFEGVVGLTVATRPDALPPAVLDLLSELNKRTVLTVELGLQSVFDETAARMNRCHTYAEFLCAYRALKERGIAVCVHLIDGLPGESREMMLESAEKVGDLIPDFIKFHALYLCRGSALAAEYEKKPFPLLSMEEYVGILADQIQRLPPETVVERVTGDPLRSALVAPLWTSDKKKTIALLDKTLAQRGTFQGSCRKCTKIDHGFCPK